ncbi:hypothetical protein [Sinomicrobium oceani]|uniref:hypothetical protein n=1 Tax=Sinomicrobium oceani TaxID=1150368 RepID=UPI000ADDC32F|nr:hypothetical protein [Sinomicrobium oceani]
MNSKLNTDITQEEYPHFNTKAGIALIQKCVQAGKAVVGVFLGAQLIGVAEH